MTPEHLSDAMIEAYVDGELAPGAQAIAEAHIAECPACSHAIQELRTVSHTLAEATPSECVFCNGGIFWTRLAARLARPSDGLSAYAMLALLPPLLLGALGIALVVAAWLANAIGALAWLGLFPPPGPHLSRLAAAQIANPETPILVRWALNALLSGEQIIARLAATWPAAARTILHLGILHSLLTLGLAITVALFAAWAWCSADALVSEGRTQP